MTLLEQSDPALIRSIATAQADADTWTVAFAGPPGAGKSTLIAEWITRIPLQSPVAVLASDPTSPYSGGALLGDRARISGAQPDNVYYRSLATRGVRGGVASAGRRALNLLKIAKFDTVIFETVGLGQNILDVEAVADTIILVLVPEAGDDLQAMKSGILEMADIVVVNKADRPGSESFVDQITQAAHLRDPHRDPDWEVPILAVSARERTGLDRLAEALAAHRQRTRDTGRPATRRRLRRAIIEDAIDRLRLRLEALSDDRLDRIRERIAEDRGVDDLID